MAGMMDDVNQRTQLVGQNRFELLLFNLNGNQKFGINVFKVQEVIQCPPVTALPNANKIVHGITNMRGRTITILDLAMAIGQPGFKTTEDHYVIVTEYNRSTQGFLVGSVDRIVNMNWKDILPPPKGVGNNNYMTAVTKVDDKLVEIIDVEKVLAEMIGMTINVDDKSMIDKDEAKKLHILVVDDSLVARKQVKNTLEKIGLDCTLAKNGLEALKILQKATKEGQDIAEIFDVIISDIEMPEMDGYTLTTEIRSDDNLKKMPIILHTSLSGTFNTNMVKKVGADRFVAKFDAKELASELKGLLVEKEIVSS